MASRWIKLAALSLLLYSGTLWAQTETALDTWHQRVSTWTQNLGSRLDARLAGLEHPMPNNQSRLRLGVRQQFSRLDPISTTPIIDLRLALPHAQKRWGLIIQQEAPRNTEKDKTNENAAPAQPAGEQRATLISIRLTDKETVRLLRQITLSGVWRSGEVGVALQWRNRDHYPLSPQWSRKDFQQITWESISGWRGRLGYEFDHDLSARHLWRLSAILDGYLDQELLELTLASTLFAWQPQQTSITGQLYGRWNNQPWGLDQWGPRISWSRPVIRKWLLFTIAPELRFSRATDYAANPAITLSWVATFSKL